MTDAEQPKRMRRFGSARGLSTIFDSWSEVLAGTHFLLNRMCSGDDRIPKVEKGFLCRLAIVSSHQLVEISLRDTVRRYVDRHAHDVHPEIVRRIREQADGDRRLYEAIREWPWILLHSPELFDFSSEPMQSQDALRRHRNDSIHKMRLAGSFRLACAAYYTGIKVSECIEQAFFPKEKFRYQPFVDRYPPFSNEWFQTVYSQEVAGNDQKGKGTQQAPPSDVNKPQNK